MKKSNLGVIRVLTTRDDKLLNAHSRIIEEAFPSLNVISECIEDQYEGIHDKKTEEMAIPKIIKLASKMGKEVNAIVLSCAADPGLKQLREILSVPVIGAGTATASLSLSYGSKVGALGITEDTPIIIKKILGPHLVAEAKPEGVTTTLDLLKNEGPRLVLDAARSLQSESIDVIALCCTGYSTIRISSYLQKNIGVPVIDPIVASGLFAWHRLRNYDKSNITANDSRQ